MPERVSLRALRELSGETQVWVAAAAYMSQAEVSRLETRSSFDECLVSTLARYLSCLGGRLELVAVFRDGHRATILPAPAKL